MTLKKMSFFLFAIMLQILFQKNFLPLQPGDVPETFADISQSKTDLRFNPKVKISEGIPKFIQWYKSFYNVP